MLDDRIQHYKIQLDEWHHQRRYIEQIEHVCLGDEKEEEKAC